MKRLSLFLISILVLLYSLNCQKSATITINVIKDSCYVLTNSINGDTIEASRDLRIIENSFTDTVVLGNAVLLPGYIGQFKYLRYGNNIIDPKEQNVFWPPTNMICIHFIRQTKGKLVIKYAY